MSVIEPETPAAPGTGETPAPAATPPAGALNTDNGGGGTPDTIPYSRFKEVNDQLAELRGYAPLNELGWDADSLRQLAAFEAQYSQDPLRVLAELVDGRPDLPDDAKEAIKEHLNASATTPPPAGVKPNESSGDADEPPAWAKPLLEDYTSRQQSGEEAERAEKLETIMQLWTDKDKEDQLKPTPERTMLAHIAMNAPHFSTLEEIAEPSRKDFMATREHVLGGALTTSRDTLTAGSPRPVPGGAGVLPTNVPKPKTLAESSALVRAALQAGTIPAIGGERS